jgi:hypothetical protein
LTMLFNIKVFPAPVIPTIIVTFVGLLMSVL